MISTLLLPDRDNTFFALTYLPDGQIVPSEACKTAGLAPLASATLALVGLQKACSSPLDENGCFVPLDRVAQRMEAWATAKESKLEIDTAPDNAALHRAVANIAKAMGFFSIWMTVFADNPLMRKHLINAFPGTSESGCFDAVTSEVICPSPNLDHLADGGKC